MRCSPLLSPQMRLLIVKDLRLFRRDPVQWSQFMIFFGLLGLYFANIRRFSYDVNYTAWVNMISFLNLAVVGLILSTFTTRFIFPMLSLEGRRFWILGMLPVKPRLDPVGQVPVRRGRLRDSLLLVDPAQRHDAAISPLVMAIHQLTCLLLCWGCLASRWGWGRRCRTCAKSRPRKSPPGLAAR